MPEAVRLEHDLLGDREVPADALYGIHTLRAVENFPLTGTSVSQHPRLVAALAMVKQAAAEANLELGVLDARRAGAIVAACREIAGGALHEWFVVDVLQGGAGTSTNMNANEVVANRALQLLGCPLGAYDELHPLEHVNASQSTNDVYPTALRLALVGAAGDLDAALGHLEAAFGERAAALAGVPKTGRTQLQDAVPMTVGDELRAWSIMVGEDRQRLGEAAALLHEVNLGGTATGTGLNAPKGYAEVACRRLADISGVPVGPARDLIEATQDAGAYVTFSGTLKRIAVKLSKICNDLRLLSSGPSAGLAELRLPAMQAGSSIMPGKVNPVIPEAVNQVAFRIVGADVAVTFAVEAGQLQLNAFGPLIAHELLGGTALLARAARMLADRCVQGITPTDALLGAVPDDAVGLVTALNPIVGYREATSVARDAQRTGRSVDDVVVERGLLTRDEVARLRRQALGTGAGAGA